MARTTTQVEIEGKELTLSNLEKVFYPETGFTKGQMIDYYARVAPTLLPHLKNRAISLKRYPDGVEGNFFYEKQKPKHAPDWIETVAVETSRKTIDYVMVNNAATLIWVANMASLEIHPFLALSSDVLKPTKITFDLDPGPPADIVQCCEVALLVRDLLDDMGLVCFPKTSGSKGMQLEVPLNTDATFDQTKSFARAVAQLLEGRHEKLVVSKMEKAVRANKIFIDWSQNDDAKTTVSAYSLRAKSTPTVSTPVTWDEVETGAGGKALSFTSDETLQRIVELGDLQAPVLSTKQDLPDFG